MCCTVVVDRIYLGNLPDTGYLALIGIGVTTPIVSILMGLANLCGTVFVTVSLGMNPFINAQGFGRTGMMTVVLEAVSQLLGGLASSITMYFTVYRPLGRLRDGELIPKHSKEEVQ